jgi:hypothetical protein
LLFSHDPVADASGDSSIASVTSRSTSAISNFAPTSAARS